MWLCPTKLLFCSKNAFGEDIASENSGSLSRCSWSLQPTQTLEQNVIQSIKPLQLVSTNRLYILRVLVSFILIDVTGKLLSGNRNQQTAGWITIQDNQTVINQSSVWPRILLPTEIKESFPYHSFLISIIRLRINLGFKKRLGQFCLWNNGSKFQFVF